MKFDSHLLLVSAQATPNLTPLLDERLRPKRVILLVSPDMTQRATWLENVINPKGIKTERWPIPDAYDIEQIRDSVFELLEGLANDHIALNATGGTKPMSIAAYEIFRAFEKTIFYVHPEHDRLIWMYPPRQETLALADRIQLPDFLNAYGAQVINQGAKHGVPAAERELTEHLCNQGSLLHEPLKLLNYYAAEAKTRLGVKLEKRHLSYGAFRDLCQRFAALNYLSLQNDQLSFPDENARFYVNGGWLEQHVYGLCLNLKKELGIQDIARSMEVARGQAQTPVKNEMDVVLLKDNRLYLIECKTHSEKPAQSGKNTAALYKLDSLKELVGGLQARAMLVNYASLNASDRQRANELGIAVCDGPTLTHLSMHLRQWLSGQSG